MSFYRGQAIIYACQGNKAQAEKSIQKVEHYITKGESSYGFYQAERELTELVKEHIRQALYKDVRKP
ncbi:hypothetical protein P9B03_09915 [Metasolibacillus meyeri]|uniref:Uncharacterized protein n=1 Tax=Metasolibacillus meyeri TaxID=1071052 RepID=A0AAW9NS48_9BACL|nr:hypothetical protein [Metasolibacillus meyeri]MEC1178798.1 hypothetical protein [Metasolibacillus meyeri]